jgi:hypothetical protein
LLVIGVHAFDCLGGGFFQVFQPHLVWDDDIARRRNFDDAVTPGAGMAARRGRRTERDRWTVTKTLNMAIPVTSAAIRADERIDFPPRPRSEGGR